jgi:diaminopimelate epimerase
MTQDLGPSVPFFKMQGGGNDFVAIDNRSLGLPVEAMPRWAIQVCRRAFGVGADGIFFLEDTPPGRTEDYVWHFYNGDGSRAGMCGNASRCAARLAFTLGLAGQRHVLGTDRGPVPAEYFPDTRKARTRMPRPDGLKLNMALDVDGAAMTVHFVDTGVPHAVVLLDTPEDLAGLDVKRFGHALRFHPAFQPAGTNANFAAVTGPDTLRLRTYERGVEDETYACGTGSAAVAVVGKALGLTGDRTEITTTGNETLTLYLADGEVFLEGGAELTFTGTLYLDALGLEPVGK